MRIGVLMGGKSIEKEVSFNSGRTVCDHLDTLLYDVVPLFQSNERIYLLPWYFLHRGKTSDFEHRLSRQAEYIPWDDLKKHIDFMYIAQHGRYAEDGSLQGFLEILNIPYFGSRVLASALRMDKITQKIFLNNAGIATPRYIIVEPYEIDNFQCHKDSILSKLTHAGINDYYVVKPSNEGSSLGISIVAEHELESALKKACLIEPGKKKRVIIEEKIKGMEFTCVTLHNKVTGKYTSLPPTEIIPEPGTLFFDYEQKYMPGRGIKRTPITCSLETTQRIQQTCIAVMQALEFNTMSRIDGFVTDNNTIIITDPNTLCGMAPSSFIFNQAAENNMSPSQLINHLIESSLQEHSMLDTHISQKRMALSSMNSQKIRVAVLLGGASNERETSLDSGRNVFYKLSPQKYEPLALFVSNSLELYTLTQSQLVRNSTQEIVELLHESQKIKWSDLPTIADFVFNALHGGYGENGSVQGALEILGIPYNGSSVLASALCIDKYKTNEFLASHGFDVPKNIYMEKDEWTSSEKQLCLKDLSYPLIVKPHNDGCSVLVQKITDHHTLVESIDKILHKKNSILIEEYINGMELTVGVIGNSTARALPPSQAINSQGILSIEEKFLPGVGENQTPAPLPQETLRLIQDTIEKVYTIVGCKGYARIDCFYQDASTSPTGKERIIILEINTLPGLTPATCLFHQAAEIGLKPMEFIDTIISLGFEEHTPQSNAPHDTKPLESTL